MRMVQRRIRQLEKELGLVDREAPYVHRIQFVDATGSVTGTMVLSDDPALCESYRRTG